MNWHKPIPWNWRIDAVFWILMLMLYYWLGQKVAALDNATRILGNPQESGFKITFLYLIIHFCLIVLLPVFLANRLTRFWWDRTLLSKH